MGFHSKVIRFTDFVTQFGIFFLVVILPVLFLPFTSEFYEFNKSILFLSVMLVVLVSWITNLAFTGKFSFWKTSFDIWIAGIYSATILSFIFSIHRGTSLLGYSGRLSEGIVVFSFMVVFTLVMRQIVSKDKVIELFMWGIVFSGAIVGLITTLQYFGIYTFGNLPRFDFVQIRSFSTLGSTHVLPYFFLIVIPVIVGFLVVNSRKVLSSVAIVPLLVLSFFGFIISAGNFWSWPGIFLWIALIAAVVFIVSGSGRLAKFAINWLLVVLIFATVMFVVRNVDVVGSRFIATEDKYVSQPNLAHDVSWNIVSQTLSKSPVRGIFGSGPDTFAYDFTRYRPVSYNNTNNWNMRFSRSSSQILEIMSNNGILGLVMWLGMFVFTGIWLLRIMKENHSYPYDIYLTSIGISLVLVMVSSIFVYFTITIWFLYWFLLGLIVAVRSISTPRLADKINLKLSLSREKISVEENDILPYLMLLPALILLAGGLYWMIKIYRAEIYYQNARYTLGSVNSEDESMQYLISAYYDLLEAVDYAGFRDNYHADCAVVSMNIMDELLKSSIESDEVNFQADLDRLLSVATSSVEKATELNPVNVKNWETRFFVYKNLIRITNGGYGEAALASINMALKYDPVKPGLHYEKGVILSLAGLDDQSLEELQMALQLQPLMLDARYDLAVQYRKMGNIESAKTQLQIILEILNQNGFVGSPAYRQIEDVIDSLEEDSDEDPVGDEDIDFPDEETLESDMEESPDEQDSETTVEESPDDQEDDGGTENGEQE